MAHPVLIIGAGLGGLCLAQGLRKNNIPFKLFERDLRHDFRAQGYRLRISNEGVFALQDVLTPELHALFEQTRAETVPPSTRIKPDGSPLGGPGPPRPARPGPMPYTVDRSTFREVLLQGLDGHVFFGKSFDHYTVHEDKITASFTDGTMESGSLLVGADGVRSSVRRQYMPDFRIIDTGMRTIFGKTPLTPEFCDKFPEQYRHGMCLVLDPDDETRTSLLFESTHFPHADKVSDLQLPLPYMYWVLVTHHSTIPLTGEKSWQLGPEEAADLVQRITKSWHPSLRSLFEMQDVAQTSNRWILSALLDLDSWQPSSRLTLLGDAIHVMPPTGAMGANTALRDAADLARRIATAGGIGNLDEKLVGEYESSLREFAKKAIALSWQGGLKSFRLKPAEECEIISG